MAYHASVYLLLFLPPVWALWALAPQKYRAGVLLGGSLWFYWCGANYGIVWLLGIAAVVWLLGIAMGRAEELCAAVRPALDPPARKALKKQAAALKRCLLVPGVAGLVLVLVRIKYLPFLLSVPLQWLAEHRPWWPQLSLSSIAQPLGISFFLLMGISYLVDVSRGAIQPAQKYWQVLSFLCFWPHVVEGPFDRWDKTAPALLDPPAPSYRALCFGVQRMVWGLFKKIVIADRANALVKLVFDDWTQYSGAAIAVGTLCYTLQLYAEFSGCMDLALGTAEAFGVPLSENFRQPFFARSVGEFWRRWHITLGAWLREYVFQPVTVSKPMMRFGKFCRGRFGAAAGRSLPVWTGLLITWVLIGLWHGAGLIYLVYGLYYFLLQLLGEIAEPHLPAALTAKRETRWYRALQMLRTFVLVNFGMMLFRANGVMALMQMLRSLFTPWRQSLLIGIDAKDAAVLAAGTALMLAVDVLHERGHRLRSELAARPLPLRWAVMIAGVVSVMLFGAYGDNYDPAGFIYAQF